MIFQRIKAAEELESLARGWVKFAKATFPDEQETIAVAKEDAAVILLAASLIRSGDFKGAFAKINSLSESIRAEVPQDIIRFLEKKTRSGDNPFGVIGPNKYNIGD